MSESTKLYHYVIFHTDGRIEDFKTEKYSLKELQHAVGGRIELLALPFWENDPEITKWVGKGRATIYINEEGKLEDLEQNPHFQPYHLDASETITGEPWDDWVVGNAIMEVEL